VLRSEPVDEVEVQRAGGLALLGADADKIKEYVFESAKLPEIRGASICLDGLNQGNPRSDYQQNDPREPSNIREVLKRRGLPCGYIDSLEAHGCIAFAGGGGLLALVPQAIAEDLKRDIEALYPYPSGTGTITCVWEPWTQGITFRQAVERVGAKLRRAKEEKKMRPFFESLPFIRRCDSCRRRPAMHFNPEPEPAYRCRVCYKRWNLGRGQKSRWHQEFERRYNVSAEPAKDLEDIARYSDGYIGFVYADGNGMGDWIAKADSPMEYRRRSRSVHESVHEAVYKAIRCHLRPVFDRQFEVITIGGDDALLIVPGAWALAIARDICRGFAALMEERGYSGKSMSAGVAIADHHSPVYFLRLLSDELLKNAKRKSPEIEEEGTVDFLVLKTQSMLIADLAHYRGTEPLTITMERQKERLHLSYGPYTLTELDKLLALVHQGQAAGFPRSQLYILRQALSLGRFASSLLFIYQQARAMREEIKEFLRAFQEQWCPNANDIPPWERMPDYRGWREYRTVWADLVEVWDFAKEGTYASED
jgi:hypothetical protein